MAVNKLKNDIASHPYPHKFAVSRTLEEYIEKYNYLQNDETAENESESVAGRVHSIRHASSKLSFIGVRGNGFKLQVKANVQMYAKQEQFEAAVHSIHRGDIIGVEGFPARTKRGELSIYAKNVSNLLNSFFGTS